MTARSLDQASLGALVTGSAVLGCGGGGSLAAAHLLEGVLGAAPQPVQIVDTGDIAADEYVAVIAVVAAQNASPQLKANPVTIATRAFDEFERVTGRKFRAVLPIEIGAGSSLVPMLVAISRNVPVVDAAGAGRAVPFVNMVTFSRLAIGPIVVTNGLTDKTLQPGSYTGAEDDLRKLIGDANFGNVGVYAMWALSGAQLQDLAISGCLAHAQDLGAKVQAVAGSGGDPVAAAATWLNGRVLVNGKVQAVDNKTCSGGLEAGRVVVSGSSGTFTLYNLNENVAAFNTSTNQLVAQGPELICYVRPNGDPVTNSEIKQGDDLCVIVAPAPRLMQTRPIQDAFTSAAMEAVAAHKGGSPNGQGTAPRVGTEPVG